MVQITRVPDLVVISALTASPNPVNVGDELAYSADVVNHGLAGDATGVTVTLPLPAQVEGRLGRPEPPTARRLRRELEREPGATSVATSN